MILVKKEQITRGRARFSEVLWDMFTGDKKYKAILKNALLGLFKRQKSDKT
jgi:hypothetical protein